jgi:hypothetical protein
MVSAEKRQQLAEDALARRVPSSTSWSHSRRQFESPPGTDIWFEYPSPDQRQGQHLVLLLRRDGVVQVEWHVAVKKGSPFELFLPTDRDPVETVIDEAAQFVADVLRDDVVLAYQGGWIGGGGRFLERHEVPGARRDLRFLWIVSWNGTPCWAASKGI